MKGRHSFKPSARHSWDIEKGRLCDGVVRSGPAETSFFLFSCQKIESMHHQSIVIREGTAPMACAPPRDPCLPS